MRVVAFQRHLPLTTPQGDLDNAVAAAMEPANGDILTAYWYECDGEILLTTVFAGPEMIVAARAAGATPRDLVSKESLKTSLQALGPTATFGKAADANARLGVLSERFESNGKPGAIGHDSTGGFSYGLYQLASKMGRVAGFIDFLSRAQKPLADALIAAGGDAAARAGTPAFKAAWRELADRSPEFAAAQHAFIEATHYAPFCIKVARDCRLDMAERSFAVQNVGWSTAVQHGPGCSIFKRALGSDASGFSDADIINRVYDERSRVDVHFKSSTAAVKASVRKRFQTERAEALKLLA